MSQSPYNTKHTPGLWRADGGLLETKDGMALGIAHEQREMILRMEECLSKKGN